MSSPRLLPQAFTALAATALLASLGACVVAAPPPAVHHPAYLHALTDLRDARWNLEHRPGDLAVSAQEDVAIGETDAAINDVKTAAAEDGKNLADHPHEDARIDRDGRLHHAVELLRKARADVNEEEDNPQSRDLRGRIEHHIGEAIRATERAIRDVEQRR